MEGIIDWWHEDSQVDSTQASKKKKQISIELKVIRFIFEVSICKVKYSQDSLAIVDGDSFVEDGQSFLVYFTVAWFLTMTIIIFGSMN